MDRHHLKKVYGWLSNTIVEVLSDEIINEETLLIFSTYLKVGVFKSYSPSICIEKLPSFPKPVYVTIQKVLKTSSADNYDWINHNKDILIEVCENVCQQPSSKNTNWLHEWINQCSTIFSIEKDKDQTCIDLLKIIDDHLEISEKYSNAQLCMIYEGLQLFFCQK